MDAAPIPGRPRPQPPPRAESDHVDRNREAAPRAARAFGGEFLELVPNERIRHTDRFDDANLPCEMRTTITLRQVSCGTELQVVQEGVPEAIPVEACHLGWQESLAQLAHLVEPEVPG